MDKVNNSGRFVWSTFCVILILICSLAWMGHPWNVFEVGTAQIYRCKNRQLIIYLFNKVPFSPAACQAVALLDLRYVRKPFTFQSSDPWARPSHILRPSSIFSRSASIYSEVGFLTQYSNLVRLCRPTPSCQTLGLSRLQPKPTHSANSFRHCRLARRWEFNLIRIC
jgi:hypothetical protein